jgi:hypothetical protein
MMDKKRPLEMSEDVRGDLTLFIPKTARMDCPKLIDILKRQGTETFFRIIDDKGNQTSSHGWIRFNPMKKLAEVVQWG